jgi:hypothetical protein
MFLMYISAIGVSIALESQARRQRLEIARECARLGLPITPSGPKIQMLESLLNIVTGVMMITPAASGFILVLGEPAIAARTEPGIGEFYSVLLAGGLTLLFLGGKALRENLRQRRQPSQPAGGNSGVSRRIQ